MSVLAALPSVAARGRPLAGVSLGEVIAAIVLVVVAVNVAIVALRGWVWWRDERTARRPLNDVNSARGRRERDWS
ncbi:hypothetical protein ACNAW0_21625 [Micromonospora sp. SL1-18]|uniref:hypothetical protein n=1 Tax=Micromonospora sp. SL1-18 TaxID=3399128 RepID=UPI003A4DD79B